MSPLSPDRRAAAQEPRLVRPAVPGSTRGGSGALPTQTREEEEEEGGGDRCLPLAFPMRGAVCLAR